VKLARINLSAALVDQPQLLQRLIKRGWDLKIGFEACQSETRVE
jgi:hypothetical protein